MYADILHTKLLPDLKKRTKSCVVLFEHLESSEDGQEEQPMDICVVYAKSMTQKCGLADANVNRLLQLPNIIAAADSSTQWLLGGE